MSTSRSQRSARAGAETELVPMDAPAFRAFVEQTAVEYAADKVASGQWRASDAEAMARRELDELLPQGLATPGHRLFTLCDAESGDAVGTLWIAEQVRGGRTIAYVYDIAVAPAHRRRGHAARAFEALEAMVRELGWEGIALHVFGHNDGARALYEGLGFRPTNIHLFKEVASAKA